jgi:hypothetical protein
MAAQASSWRRLAVQPVLDAYAASGAVDAVMLSGSTAFQADRMPLESLPETHESG